MDNTASSLSPNSTFTIPEEFEQYWSDQRELALGNLCEEENLDKEEYKSLIDAYIYNEHEPLRDEIFKCLDNRPSVLKAWEIGEGIINKRKDFVEVFVRGLKFRNYIRGYPQINRKKNGEKFELALKSPAVQNLLTLSFL